jgi:hypothetical protein
MPKQRGGRKRTPGNAVKSNKGRERARLEVRARTVPHKKGYHAPGSLQTGRCR